MATSFDQFARELAAFAGSREITKALGRAIRKTVPPVRRAIRDTALETMPHAGGLNVWVSRIRVTAQIRVSGRKAGVKLKGGRNSQGGRSDIRAIDLGTVRAPSWGHRTAAAWHAQAVTPGFFTQTSHDLPDWRDNIDAEVDRSLEILRRGR